MLLQSGSSRCIRAIIHVAEMQQICQGITLAFVSDLCPVLLFVKNNDMNLDFPSLDQGKLELY